LVAPGSWQYASCGACRWLKAEDRVLEHLSPRDNDYQAKEAQTGAASSATSGPGTTWPCPARLCGAPRGPDQAGPGTSPPRCRPGATSPASRDQWIPVPPVVNDVGYSGFAGDIAG